MIGMGNRSTRRKPARVPLCPPQTPHAARTRTRAAAVGSQRLTAELRHGLRKMFGNSSVTERLVASQVGLSTMKLVTSLNTKNTNISVMFENNTCVRVGNVLLFFFQPIRTGTNK
jgi:hypothetical protein